MDIQNIIVAIILIIAALYVGKKMFGKIKSFSPKDKNCGNDCGCDSKSGKIPTQIRRN
jgi:hypothetical protein